MTQAPVLPVTAAQLEEARTILEQADNHLPPHVREMCRWMLNALTKLASEREDRAPPEVGAFSGATTPRNLRRM